MVARMYAEIVRENIHTLTIETVAKTVTVFVRYIQKQEVRHSLHSSPTAHRFKRGSSNKLSSSFKRIIDYLVACNSKPTLGFVCFAFARGINHRAPKTLSLRARCRCVALRCGSRTRTRASTIINHLPVSRLLWHSLTSTYCDCLVYG